MVVGKLSLPGTGEKRVKDTSQPEWTRGPEEISLVAGRRNAWPGRKKIHSATSVSVSLKNEKIKKVPELKDRLWKSGPFSKKF